MGQFIEQIVAATNERENASEKLLTLIEMHFSQLAANHHLAIVTQLELRQSNLSLRQQINRILKPYLVVIDEIVKEGVEEKLFRSDIKIPLIRQMIFGTLDETVTNWVMNEEKYDLIGLAPSVHELITKGVSVK